MIENIELGKILNEIRVYKGLKKTQLGKLINKTSDSIKKYENGYTTVPIHVLEDICTAMGCNLEIIIKCDTKEYKLDNKKTR